MGRPAVNRQSGDHEGRRLMKSIASRVWTRTCMKIITRRANGDWSEMKDKFQELTLLERVEKGKTEDVVAESLTQELLETDKCYILDCGLEVYVWMGKNTSLDRKDASGATDGFLSCLDHKV
ncbi:Villin-4-like [Orobanche minor]